MSDTPLSIEEIHKGTLEILKKIIEICDEININYFVAYGSLIGAVRHKGFIPWDDDFDIMMLRPDYEIFCKYCEENRDKLGCFKLMSKFNTPDYPFNIPRFCDLRYRMESEGYLDAGMGMFIDIYPVDGAGNIEYKRFNPDKFKKKMYIKLSILTLNNEFIPSSKGKIHNAIKYLLFRYFQTKGDKYFLRKWDKMSEKYSFTESKYLSVMVWDQSLYYYEREWFDDFVYLEFEGMQVKVPHKYDEVLKKIYGDYMKLPPKEQQIATHSYKLYRND